MMKPDANPFTPQTLRLIRCAVQGEEYCLEMSAVRSLGRAHQIVLQADAEELGHPAGTIGWLATRQQKFPVFDLAQRLHLAPLPQPQDVRTGFVALINAPQPFALRVNNVTGNLRVNHTQMATLPRIVEPNFGQVFKGIVTLPDKWVLCVDAAPLYFDVHLRPVEKRPSSGASPLPNAAPLPARTKLGREVFRAKTRAQIMLFSAALNVAEPTESLPLVFGLSIAQVQEITDLTKIIPIPGAPNYVYGVTNWRNVPIPILHLPARLGLSAAPVSPQQIAPKSRLLIARAQEGWLGFPIKPQVKAFPLPIPYQPNQHRLALDQDLVKGIFDLEGAPLLIPDVDAILTQKFVPRPRPVPLKESA
jgi:chemotaxis signal transduction protein